MDALRDDPTIGPLIKEYGVLELETTDEPFERLVISIVNQQLSTAAAESIRTQLFERVEPTPSGILDSDEEFLREIGLSAKKVEYLDSAARTFLDRDLTRESFAEMQTRRS